jgi:hypothetical protein
MSVLPPEPAQGAGGRLGAQCEGLLLIIQLLSLEYTALRDEMLTRISGRFQFLGLMTATPNRSPTCASGSPSQAGTGATTNVRPRSRRSLAAASDARSRPNPAASGSLSDDLSRSRSSAPDTH